MRRKIALIALCCVLLSGAAASINVALNPDEKVTAYYRDHPNEYAQNLSDAGSYSYTTHQGARDNVYYQQSHEIDVPAMLVTLLGIGMATSCASFVALIAGGLIFAKKET
jgi:hypothetical protein